MKKHLFILLALVVTAVPAFAAISTDDIMSDTYIRNHGHSEEMVRLINLQNNQINGKLPMYKNEDPEWYTADKRVNFIRNVFKYFDCGLDVGNFGSDKIKYSTRYDDL